MSMVYGPLFPTIRVVSNIKNSKDRNDSESKDIGGDTTCVLKPFLSNIDINHTRIHSHKKSMNRDHSQTLRMIQISYSSNLLFFVGNTHKIHDIHDIFTHTFNHKQMSTTPRNMNLEAKNHLYLSSENHPNQTSHWSVYKSLPVPTVP